MIRLPRILSPTSILVAFLCTSCAQYHPDKTSHDTPLESISHGLTTPLSRLVEAIAGCHQETSQFPKDGDQLISVLQKRNIDIDFRPLQNVRIEEMARSFLISFTDLEGQS